jgi:hypothetical protein
LLDCEHQDEAGDFAGAANDVDVGAERMTQLETTPPPAPAALGESCANRDLDPPDSMIAGVADVEDR